MALLSPLSNSTRFDLVLAGSLVLDAISLIPPPKILLEITFRDFSQIDSALGNSHIAVQRSKYKAGFHYYPEV